ncbi:hypothetical protein [Verrucomicrobium spinosum]|uniref:hypothetical protein n=1 Tax=Verrucomicrobium spinosum TaxID=2736 RepID=UPI001C445C96|nr:hypothetical protein [Verrucomicrobium spinosum]
MEFSDPAFTGPGLRFATVKSNALKRRADVALFTPQGYMPKSLPLVILLHGVYGSHWAWALKGGAHRVLQRLVSRDEVPPMMLAMPSDGLWGDGSGYLAHQEADYAPGSSMRCQRWPPCWHLRWRGRLSSSRDSPWVATERCGWGPEFQKVSWNKCTQQHHRLSADAGVCGRAIARGQAEAG